MLICIPGLLLAANSSLAPDTLKPVSFHDSCAWRVEPNIGLVPDLFVPKNPNGGYIAGNSIYGMKTKAQKYYNADGGLLTSAVCLFGEKDESGTPGQVSLKIFAVDSTGAPGTMIGQSLPVNLENVKASRVNIDSVEKLTTFSFFEPLTVPDSFFIGIDLTMLSSGDSVGLFTTKDGCYSGQQLAWEQAANGSWQPFNDGTPTSWQLDIDMAIFPIGDFGLGTGISNHSDVETQVLIFPNPASHRIFFRGNWKEKEIGITLFDLTGRQIQYRKVRPDGLNSFELNINYLPEGAYLYKIEANYQSTGKLIISR